MLETLGLINGNVGRFLEFADLTVVKGYTDYDALIRRIEQDWQKTRHVWGQLQDASPFHFDSLANLVGHPTMDGDPFASRLALANHLTGAVKAQIRDLELRVKNLGGEQQRLQP